AFNYLGNTVYGDQLFYHSLIVIGHVFTPPFYSLKFKSMRSCSLSQSLDTTMIFISGSIKGHPGDTGGFGAFGDSLTYQGCRYPISTIRDPLASQDLIQGRGTRHRYSAIGSQDLSIDM